MIDDTVKDETVEATAEEAVETEVTEAPASLSVQDLANIRNIIDVASQRGAFKTNEFTVVGATYTKLTNFLNAVAPQIEAAQAEAPAEEAGEEVAAEE